MKLSRNLQTLLLTWYELNARRLPWRIHRDPYKIWISEVMLQQTTVTTVRPYYELFISRFPNLESLATSALPEVIQAWSGLGYYTRARNLHRAAKELHGKRFPRSYRDLIKLPGFGPYTARAVASIAFDESVGVLDGNVIRVLTRHHLLPIEWWKPTARTILQNHADLWVQKVPSGQMNQALMELGATICTAQNPKCLVCPIFKTCGARISDKTEDLPLQKPRRATEVWVWSPLVMGRGPKIALTKNKYAPFLKNHFILPGTVRRLLKKPKKFDFQHAVTHHKIFVSVKTPSARDYNLLKNANAVIWVNKKNLKQVSPSSLVEKAISFADRNRKD